MAERSYELKNTYNLAATDKAVTFLGSKTKDSNFGFVAEVSNSSQRITIKAD